MVAHSHPSNIYFKVLIFLHMLGEFYIINYIICQKTRNEMMLIYSHIMENNMQLNTFYLAKKGRKVVNILDGTHHLHQSPPCFF